eukprot:TRINITY_DN6239_c0_g1_i1.p2 TRINITY_DN6239_c0_g1~~TRINITY_DN6239_c0_g1_i1.p2  ORF type:complete len:302 (-),score=121.95 TRINITY_DN6239_c0_g1_i1:481-1332(-)
MGTLEEVEQATKLFLQLGRRINHWRIALPRECTQIHDGVLHVLQHFIMLLQHDEIAHAVTPLSVAEREKRTGGGDGAKPQLKRTASSSALKSPLYAIISNELLRAAHDLVLRAVENAMGLMSLLTPQEFSTSNEALQIFGPNWESSVVSEGDAAPPIGLLLALHEHCVNLWQLLAEIKALTAERRGVLCFILHKNVHILLAHVAIYAVLWSSPEDELLRRSLKQVLLDRFGRIAQQLRSLDDAPDPRSPLGIIQSRLRAGQEGLERFLEANVAELRDPYSRIM